MGGRTAVLASLVLALAGLGAIGSGGSAQAAEPVQRCNLGKFAELPVTMVGRRPHVQLKIDGVDTPFTVDSGSFFSVMNKAAVERFHLSTRMAPFGYAVRGTGGRENRVDIATVKHFGLGEMDIPDVVFLELPQAEAGAAGLIGQNVLSLFDTEYDIGNGMVRLMQPSEACRQAGANLAYWADGKPIGVVDVRPIDSEQRHLKGDITINGHKVEAIFDTGASASVLKRSVAEKIGFRVDAPEVRAQGAGRGIGPKASETWNAPFDLIDIGGEKISHTRLQVADIDLPNGDMLLGIDFFLSHRVYVSKRQHKIYFTYNGGPVFRLEPRRGDLQQADATPADDSAHAAAGAPQAANYADAPTDAASYVRRAEASMARRDYPGAVADFGKAIALEPTAQHYVQRAGAHVGAGEAALAMADFDEALKLQPGNIAALVGRGRLYMISHDLARGQADLDAAVKADPNAAMAVGTIYANNQRFETGVADMDLWIERHPQSDALATALMERCRARTLWNHDLDKALADCDAAIRRGPTTAVMFETRGLAHLRRGEADAALADFNRALKEQPKLAWALYGRSVVERAKGEAAPAEADLTAAKAIAPRLPDAGRRYGFEGAAAKSAG